MAFNKPDFRRQNFGALFQAFILFQENGEKIWKMTRPE